MKQFRTQNKFKRKTFFFFSLTALQGFFKDLLTVNNPHVSPQRIEEYVNAAVGNHGNSEGLRSKGCVCTNQSCQLQTFFQIEGHLNIAFLGRKNNREVIEKLKITKDRQERGT